MKDAFLDGRSVALSISTSPDLRVLGLSTEHVEDAMAEIARHLMACGAALAYGGDLREGGFTELLFEIVNRYRANKDSEKILVKNYLAWPVHASMDVARIEALQQALKTLAQLILLTPSGKEIELTKRPAAPQEPSGEDWVKGLTAMRMTMASKIAARIALGGATTGYKGKLPGIAEESLIQLQRKAPLFLVGGFGGCAYDLTCVMGLNRRGLPRSKVDQDWNGLELFRGYRPADLHNGLTADENQRLAETAHIDEAVTLILRGLLRIVGKHTRRRRKT